MRAQRIVALAVLGLALAGCKSADSVRSDPPPGEAGAATATNPTPPVRPPAQLLITPAGGGEPVTVYVEVVRETRDIRRGLMYRQHMPPDQGMLFLMGEESVHTFWMKNTLISLDMIFIGRDKTIVGIVENTVPLSKETRSVDGESLYVLEVNAGWSAKHGVGAGATVRFVDVNE